LWIEKGVKRLILVTESQSFLLQKCGNVVKYSYKKCGNAYNKQNKKCGNLYKQGEAPCLNVKYTID
jgi:hypothetical protein